MALATFRCDRCSREVEAHERATAYHRCPLTGRGREMKKVKPVGHVEETT